MITLEQFREMKPGTVFYVAAPGLIRAIESNTLSEETFVKFLEGDRGCHIITECGGISFSYGKHGESFYLDKDEALCFMEERHVALHREGLKERASQIERLKREIAQMESSGPGEPNYVYHDRTFNPQGSKL